MKNDMLFAALAAVLVGWVLAAPALARPNPTPPPSGIVVHLFGPGSITSHVLPTFATSRPAVAGGPAGAAAGSPGAAQPAADEPTVGDVLHQMFVTGDPDHPASPVVAGRSAEQPRAANMPGKPVGP